METITLTPLHWLLAYAGALIYVLLKIQELNREKEYKFGDYLKKHWASTLATTATDGFFYIPSCAGIPTGVPTAKTGRVPMMYDSTNNKFYIYNGAWKSVALI